MQALYVILNQLSWFVKMIHGLNHYLIQVFHRWGPKNGEIWQNANFVKTAKLYILSSCFEFFCNGPQETTSMLTQSNMPTIEIKNKLDGEIKI